MLKSCPDPVDVSDLQFKLQCHLKIFENEDVSSLPNTNSLLTCASRYGLLFVGTNSNNFQVIHTEALHNYNPKDKDVVNYPRRNIQIPSVAKHLCVNCDNTIIAVVTQKEQCPVVIFYEVLSFLSQTIKIIKEIRLSSTPNVYVREIGWNPSLPTIFTACKSDGTLGVYELKGESVDINELPAAAGASCFCWSPKGKQIAVGSKDGRITQYKPDLKAVKAISEPKLQGPHTIINLQWVSNYQFIGVYQSLQDAACYIIVVDAPKTGEPSYTNYDDICYSGSSRPPQFYLILQQTWNFLMVASANSTEVGVLGSNGEVWTQWIMGDTARAELPLSPDHQETLPVGLTFDISSTTPLPWGESTIPPCPLLCMLSHQGVLCCFNVVYLKEGIPSVCTPPDRVSDTTGLSAFITSSKNAVQSVHTVQNQQVVSKPQQVAPAEFKLATSGSQLQSTGATSKDGTFSVPTSTFALNIPSQSTPLASEKGPADTVSKTLFGGQATLTPIKPQQPSQGFPLFGGSALITPIGKNPNGTVITSSTSTGQSTNFGEKYASIFSSLNPTTLPQSITTPVKPIVISAAAVKSEVAITPKEDGTKFLETVSKPQEVISKAQVSLSRESQRYAAITKQDSQIADSKVDTSAMLSQMIRDEWMYLEAELKVLIDIGRTVKVSVGTDIEKIEMIKQIESLQEFVKEAVDISIGQSNEIHCLKQNLIQSWAWFEEAKSQYNSSKNEAVALLIKLQPLDSLSQKRLRDIEQLIYYIESQLSQASKTLDEQWDNFQDYAKKTHKVKMPTMEAIFQTMVRQNAILQKHTYLLKDISMRLRIKAANATSLLISLDKGRDLADDFQELRLDSQNILQLQYEKIKNHAKHLSDTKINKLRNLLNQREVTRVTAVKPQLSSWSITQSPASRMRKSISMLGTSLSPAVKSSVARNLDFIQSTLAKSPEVTAPLKPLQEPLLSFETPGKSASAVTSNPTSAQNNLFTLVKSGPVISSSQGSAFTPIGGIAMSVATSGNHKQLFKSNVSPMPSFSFGGGTATANKSVPSFSQIAPALPNQEFTGASAPSMVTTGSNKGTFSSGGDANSIFKPAPDTVKPQSVSASNTFLFSSSSAAPKSIFAATPHTASNFAFSSSNATGGFQFTAAPFTSPLGNSSNQLNKAGTLTSTAVDNEVTKSVPQTLPNVQGPHQTTSEPIPKTVTTAAVTSSVSTTLKPASGVASIFANLQSVIDKATSSTTAVSSVDNTKSCLSFSAASNTATTTVQSVFGSISSTTSVTKPLFGTLNSNTASSGSLFDHIPKSATDSTPFTTQNQFGIATNSLVSTSVSTSIFGKSTKVTDIEACSTMPDTTVSQVPESLEASKTKSSDAGDAFETTREPSTPTNVITVSLFGSKSSADESVKDSSVPSTVTTTSIFGNTTVLSPSQPGKDIFGNLTLSSATVQETVTSATPSVFETSKMTSPLTPSIINSAPTVLTTKSSIFGSPPKSGLTFASSLPSSTTSAASSTASNIFATNNATSTSTGSASSIFSSSVAPATGSSVFGTPATSVFGSPAASKNIFGASAVTTAISATTSATSIFGTSVAPTNTFGTPTCSSAFESSSTKPNIFASPSSGSIFGAAPSAENQNIFQAPQSTATTNAAIFGTPATTPANIFASSTPISTVSNIFGSGTATNTASPFGTQSGSIFGAPNTAGNVFGQPATFGGNTAFGGVQATTASSVFGQSPAFGSSGGTVFGSTTTATPTSGNIFGSPVSSSGFGSGFSTTSTTSTFGSTAATQPSAGSFGFGGLSVGGASSPGSIFGGSTGGAFGQTTTAANPFGKVETKPAFGSSTSTIFGNAPLTSTTTNVFGSPASTASSIFGSSSGSAFGSSTTGGGFGSSSVFGGTSSFGQKPAFGQQATFGSTSFGSTQPGPFSGGGTSPVAQSGFGSPPSFQKPSGFGSPPVFGGSPAPAFGASPSFGGSPTFGSAPTFGTPEKVFGSSQSTSGGFAATPQQSTGFGNLASQNTIGFGNLAQQASTPASMPFSGNSSFSSWR